MRDPFRRLARLEKVVPESVDAYQARAAAAEADALGLLKELGHSDPSLEIDDEDSVRHSAVEGVKSELEQRHGDIWILGWDRACKAFGDWEDEHVAIPI
jgi:hypothetical protein